MRGGYGERMSKWFIYVLRCPISWDVRYVGKAMDPADRLRRHMAASSRAKYHAGYWLESLKRLGLKPLLEIVDVGMGNGHGAAERAWIAEYRSRGANLTNTSTGGEGRSGPHSEEAKANIRASKQNVSDETRARISAGKSDPSAEVRSRMSEAQRGKRASADTRAKMAAVKTGKRHSLETRAKMSERSSARSESISEMMRKRMSTPEGRRTAASNTGKKFSEETRKRMSDSAKSRWASRRTNSGS
jgi:hypothetical protein